MRSIRSKKTHDKRLSVSRIGVKILTLPIVFYRLIISPLFPPSCRFYPSCSEYARDALETHGAVKGIWLTIRRLSRCHPWGSSGIDPVPQKHPLGEGNKSQERIG